MYHLPAYVALQRWAAGRTVVVVAPSDLVGACKLESSGARRVIVVRAVVSGSEPDDPGFDEGAGRGIEIVSHLSDLRLADRGRGFDGRVDLLVCIESYPLLRPHARRKLHDEAARLLAPGGTLAVWAPADAARGDIDYWTLEDELAASFPHLFVVAELPWQGVSWAPVLGEGAPTTDVGVVLDEGLLEQAPPVRHYLAVATRDAPSPELARAFTDACLLVPMPPRGDAAAESSVGVHDLTVLGKQVETLESSLERANNRATTLERRVTELVQERDVLATKADDLTAQSANVGRQLEVALAEREGARQLCTRVEAELELTRSRLSEQGRQLESKTEQWTTLQAQTEVLRAKLEHHESLLAQAKSREQALTESAEQGRVLTEVAQDRDRLREELGRRNRRIAELEESVWAAREDVQKERLDNVRLGGEVERLRDHAERSLAAEKARAAEVERLSQELHRIEVERTNLTATVRAREEELGGLRREVNALAGESGDLEALRTELSRRADELSRLQTELARARSKEREATTLEHKRLAQLDEAGAELERMRKTLQERSATATTLQGELEVKTLEVEQLSASVSDLMARIEAQRSEAEGAGSREQELQRDLERRAAEQEELRRRLREREQELEDLLSAHESSGVELYKLRQELEATAKTNERLEQALAGDDASADHPNDQDVDTSSWPPDAVAHVRRLQAQVANTPDSPPEPELAPSSDDARGERIRRLRLEVQIRAEEQEYILGRLDAAEQKIWEMNDAASREAARLAASLAQLEKHREQLDETVEELEITRKQLAAAQARALEQERLLASERAKLARRGMQAQDDGPSDEDVDDVFAELEIGSAKTPGPSPAQMVSLHPPMPPYPRALPTESSPSETGVPTVVEDRSGSPASGVLEPRSSPRVVVEAIEPDQWAPGGVDSNSKGPETPASAASRPRPAEAHGGSEQDTVPRARLPRPPTTGSGNTAS